MFKITVWYNNSGLSRWGDKNQLWYSENNYNEEFITWRADKKLETKVWQRALNRWLTALPSRLPVTPDDYNISWWRFVDPKNDVLIKLFWSEYFYYSNHLL